MHHHEMATKPIIVQVETELKRQFVQVIKDEDPETNLSSEIRRYMRWRVRKHKLRQEESRLRRASDRAEYEDGRERTTAPAVGTA